LTSARAEVFLCFKNKISVIILALIIEVAYKGNAELRNVEEQGFFLWTFVANFFSTYR